MGLLQTNGLKEILSHSWTSSYIAKQMGETENSSVEVLHKDAVTLHTMEGGEEINAWLIIN